MSLAEFTFSDRAAPFVEIGIGDTRVGGGQALWDSARWDRAGDAWAGTEPTWLDVTCDARSAECSYGRARTTDRFIAGTATIVVDNATGWADPNHIETPGLLTPGLLTMRPGRSIRFGVDHVVYGRCVLFRGFIDGITPTYDPIDQDTVQINCVDALGEINRAKTVPLAAAVGANETVSQRITRLLDRVAWPAPKRDILPSGTALVESDLGGQTADLLGQAADSDAGVVFGDLAANIAFRPRDWQTYPPGTPPEATIGNVEASDVCPTQWERPFERADMATRVIVGRDAVTAVQLDDATGQLIYGIEPFERINLLTRDTSRLTQIANRILVTRGYAVAPRVRSVTLDASTAPNALDLMATAAVYKPSRYRCRLRYPRGDVFDAEHFATGVHHRLDRHAWTLLMNLDLAAAYAAVGGRWDSAGWDRNVWATAPFTDVLNAARALVGASS